jgi:hypothetical protein
MGIYMGYTYHIYGLCKDPEITMAIYGWTHFLKC